MIHIKIYLYHILQSHFWTGATSMHCSIYVIPNWVLHVVNPVIQSKQLSETPEMPFDENICHLCWHVEKEKWIAKSDNLSSDV